MIGLDNIENDFHGMNCSSLSLLTTQLCLLKVATPIKARSYPKRKVRERKLLSDIQDRIADALNAIPSGDLVFPIRQMTILINYERN